jgi:hypothetical protein
MSVKLQSMMKTETRYTLYDDVRLARSAVMKNLFDKII